MPCDKSVPPAGYGTCLLPSVHSFPTSESSVTHEPLTYVFGSCCPILGFGHGSGIGCADAFRG